MEIGQQHLAAWKKEETTGKILDFELFQFSKLDSTYFATSWQEIRLLSKLLDKEIPTCEIILENEDCTLLPDHIFSEDQLENGYAYMQAGRARVPMTEKNCPGDMLAIFDRHNAVFSIIDQQIPAAKIRHKYAAILYQMEKQDNVICAFFYNTYFICAVKKEGKLQLIRHFNFQTPEDALYYLLYVRKQMQLAEDIPIIASGMIDTDSPLYKTLYRYLPGFRLESPEALQYETAGFREFPLHYFSIFCNE